MLKTVLLLHSTRCVVHFMSLSPLPQEISGVTLLSMMFAEAPSPLLFPENRELKAGQGKDLHTRTSIPWPGPGTV